MSGTFNVTDFSLFDTGEGMRSNLFEERRNNEYHKGHASKDSKDFLHVPDRPIRLSREKNIKEAMH